MILFPLWNLGTLGGALVGRAIDPADFGLDAAAPAVFLALLWRSSSGPRTAWSRSARAGSLWRWCRSRPQACR